MIEIEGRIGFSEIRGAGEERSIISDDELLMKDVRVEV